MALPAYIARLGTLRFHGWTPWVPAPQTIGEDFYRLGQTEESGGAQTMGTRSREIDCTAWAAFTSATEATAFAALVENAQRQELAFIDQWGFSILVRVVKSAAMPKATRGAATYRVDCSITVKCIGTP